MASSDIHTRYRNNTICAGCVRRCYVPQPLPLLQGSRNRALALTRAAYLVYRSCSSSLFLFPVVILHHQASAISLFQICIASSLYSRISTLLRFRSGFLWGHPVEDKYSSLCAAIFNFSFPFHSSKIPLQLRWFWFLFLCPKHLVRYLEERAPRTI